MINSENEKLIKQFNYKMRRVIGCDIFQLIYDYAKKDLFINKVNDTKTLGLSGKKKFIVETAKPIFEKEVSNEDMYLYLIGMIQEADLIIAFIEYKVKEMHQRKPIDKTKLNWEAIWEQQCSQ